MAEFKLGRIKFVWQGAWTSGNSYLVDDVVSNGGKSYICVSNHVASSAFVSDSGTKWNLVADGTTWKGSWAPSTYYEAGAQVKYGGLVYVCNTAHRSASNTVYNLTVTGASGTGTTATLTFSPTQGSSPFSAGQTITVASVNPGGYNGPQIVTTSTTNSVSYLNATIFSYISGGTITTIGSIEQDLAKWDLFSASFNWTGTWLTTTKYKINDIVSYGGQTYVCNTTHTSQTYLEDDQSKWTSFNAGLKYQGSWSGTSTHYAVNDVVKYGGDLWICQTAHVSTSTFDGAKFGLFINGLQFESSWVGGTTYQLGDIVTYGGYTYICTQNHATTQIPSATGSLYWSVYTTGFNFRGDYASANSYKVGDVVRQGSYTYLALTDSSVQTLTSGTTLASNDVSNPNSIVVSSTANLVLNLPIVFTGTTLGGIQTSTTYYVKTIQDATHFTISSVSGGTVFALTAGSGSTMTITSVPNPPYSTYWTQLNSGLKWLPQTDTYTSVTPTAVSSLGTGASVNVVRSASAYTVTVYGSSSGTIVTVASTSSLTAGMTVTVASGVGAFVSNSTIVSILNSTQFTVGQVPTTALSAATITAQFTLSPITIPLKTFSGASSVGTTVSVNDTTGLVAGLGLVVTGGTGAFAAGTTIQSITNATQFVVSQTPSTPLATATITIGATSSGTTVTCASTTGLVAGLGLSVTSGTGTLQANTTIQSITNSTQFVVSLAPSVALYDAAISAGATSSSTTITVPSTTGLVAGLTLGVSSGTGSFSGGTTIQSVTNSTQFVASSAPSVALFGATVTATSTLNHSGGSGYSVNDTLKVAGTSLGGLSPANDLAITVSSVSSGRITGVTVSGYAVTWKTATTYVLGDVALFGANSYICVLSHVSASGNRPDADTTATYWNLLTAGAEQAVMTSPGDMFYYGLNGPTRLATGTNGQLLRVSSTGYPTWSYWGNINNLIYVGPNGVDSPAPAYGISIDKPFASVRYAALQVEKGYLNPNSRDILQKNKQFVLKEVNNYVLYTYQVSISSNSSGTNQFTATSTSGIYANMPISFTTTTGGVTVGTTYYVKTVVDTTHFTISSSISNGVAGAVFALSGVGTTNSGSYVYSGSKTERDAGIVYDALIFDLTHGGTVKTTAATKAYFTTNGATFASGVSAYDVIPFNASLNYMVTLIGNVLSNAAPSSNYQTLNSASPTAVQIIDPTLTAESTASTYIQNLITILTTALSANTASGVPVAITPATTINVKTGTYSEILPISVPSYTAIVGDELRSTVVQPTTANPLLATVVPKAQAALTRISGLIPNLIANTVITPTTGNSQSLSVTGVTNASGTVTLAYSTQSTTPFTVGQYITVSGFSGGAAGYNGSYRVTAVTTTTVSYTNATTAASAGTPVVSSQNTNLPTGSTGSSVAVTNLKTSYDILYNLVSSGVGSAPPVVMPQPTGFNTSSLTNIAYATTTGSNSTGDTTGYGYAVQQIQNNYAFLVADTLQYLINNYNTIWLAEGTDGRTKGYRDIAYILDSICYDLTYGGNTQSLVSGSSYYSLYALQILATEKTPFTLALNRLKTIITTVVQKSSVSALPSNVVTQVLTGTAGSAAAGGFAQDRVQDVVDWINNTYANATVQPYTGWASAGLQTAYSAVTALTTNIASDATVWVQKYYQSVSLSTALTTRDATLVTNSLAYDMVFGSNFNAIQAGRAYTRANTSDLTLRSGPELAPTLGAINFLYYKVKQIATSGAIVQIQENINDINTYLSGGSAQVGPRVITWPQPALPQATYTAVTGTVTSGGGDNNAAFTITRTSNNNGWWTYGITVTTAGASYTTSSKIRILGTSIGGATPTNDIVINVTQVSSGGVVAVTYSDAPATVGLLEANRPFLLAEVVSYINTNYSSITTNPTYSVAKTQRDMGYILDAVHYDLTYGGNWASQNAGMAYYSALYGTQITSGFATAFLNAINYVSGLAQQVVVGTTVASPLQATVAQVLPTAASSVGSSRDAGRIGTLITWVMGFVGNGLTDGAPKTTIVTISGTNTFTVGAGSNTITNTNGTAVTVTSASYVQGTAITTGASITTTSGLAASTTYYVAATTSSSTTVTLATSLTNAYLGVAITFTGGSTAISNGAVTVGSATHGLSAGDIVIPQTTTNGLTSTIIGSSPQYYVLSSGLTTTQFQLSASYNGTAISSFTNGTGLTIPVQTINMPYLGWVSSTALTAYQTVSAALSSYQSSIVTYLSINYAALTYNTSYAQRDTLVVTLASMLDMMLGSNYAAVQAGRAYNRTQDYQVLGYEKIATVATLKYLVTLINTTLANAAYSTVLAQAQTSAYLIINMLDLGSSQVVPEVNGTVTYNNNLGIIKGAEQLRANIPFLAAEVVAYYNATYTGSLTNTAANGTITTATNHNLSVNDPVRFTGTAGNGIALNTTYYVLTTPTPTTFTIGTGEGYLNTNTGTTYTTLPLTAATTGTLASFTGSTTTATWSTTTTPIAVGSMITVTGTSTGNGTINGSVPTAGTIYYVGGTVTATGGSLYTTQALALAGGTGVTIVAGTGFGGLTFTYTANPSLTVTYYYVQSKAISDTTYFLNAIISDLQFTGNYQSLKAAQVLLNAINGSQLSNMFLVRDSTGIRNMTMSGLSGVLTNTNNYGTKRPTAGSYSSLDPGFGPNDTNVWIINRSCYAQNCTMFGTACTGMKIDGAIHAGGNRSIVANDYTTVISDGIGVWCTGSNALTELVSVFNYYGYSGYLAELGGRIRATNGNSSYGTYGCIAEGVDSFETPLYANLNNRYNQALITNTVTDGTNQILRLEFSNAGQGYTNTQFAINGSGINAAATADEFRDGGVFETRLTDLNDGNGYGGTNYVTFANASQGGTIGNITVAATDVTLSTGYPGMRMQLTAGTGVGQYGNILTYSNGSKSATIIKPSFTNLTITATTNGTPSTVTVASTGTLYVNMPFYVASTVGGLAVSTVYYVQSIASATTFTVATSSGGAALTTQITTTTSQTVTMYAAGWDHIIPGTTIVNTLDLTTTYIIEPLITYSSPGFASAARTLPASSTWGYAAYGYGRFVAITTSGTNTAYSNNGITWTTAGVMANNTTYADVIYGGGDGTVAVVTVGGLGGYSATLVATLGVYNTTGAALADQVASVTVVSGGYGFTTPPVIVFSGTGSGAVATCTVLNGAISSVTVTTPGSGYSSAPTVTVATDRVTGVAMTAWGKNYSSVPSVTFADPFTGTAWTSSGAVTSGNYYYYINTVPIPNVKNWYLATSSGNFNTNYPTFTSGTGSSGSYGVNLTYAGTTAIAAAALTNAGVSSIVVSNSGAGYTATPALTITDPAASFVAISTATTSTYLLASAAVSAGWSNGGTLPTITNGYVGLAYGGGYVVAVGGTGTNSCARTANGGVSWSGITMPTLAQGTYSAVAYGNGAFVAVAQGLTANATAYSTSAGSSWTAGGVMPATGYWISIAYGNGRFVAITSNGIVAYSLNLGVTWTATPSSTGTTTSVLSSSYTWSRIRYGQGIFLATSTGVPAATSPDGINWTQQSLNAGASAGVIGQAFGNPGSTPVWAIMGSAAASSAAYDVRFGATPAGRMKVASGIVTEIRMIEPGSGFAKGSVTSASGTTITIATASGATMLANQPVEFQNCTAIGLANNTIYYVVTPGANSFTVSTTSGGSAITLTTATVTGATFSCGPIVTQVDPNKVKTAATRVRTSTGILANPSFSNRGTLNTTASTSTSGDGFCDIYQPSNFINVSNLFSPPTPGANVQFSSISGTWYKLVAVTNQLGIAGAYTATFQINPSLSVYNAPANGDVITTRLKYSQVRLTGHDFLYIGTGNFASTNYPYVNPNNAIQANQTNSSGGGRVFFTSTDQDGNFNVGNLFGVQQATGTATLNASAFNLSGLNSLTLGAVSLGVGSATITQFSTDPYFTANSDSIVPTQKAIKSYITAQIGGGASSLNVNTLTSGVIYIANNTISTTSGVQINVTAKMNFTGGIDGAPVAVMYFLQK